MAQQLDVALDTTEQMVKRILAGELSSCAEIMEARSRVLRDPEFSFYLCLRLNTSPDAFLRFCVVRRNEIVNRTYSS